MSVLLSFLVFGADHPHGPHLMCSLASELWSCFLCLLLGLEHRLFRLTTVGVGEG